ncbi:MAG: hypothetical protein OR997_06105 [Methylophilaceae bacterium]|nr:hypothetical protein [Methylophilaceae bacterium]
MRIEVNEKIVNAIKFDKSNDEYLTQVLGYEHWDYREAINYLLGIFELNPYDSQENTITTLSGEIISETENSELIAYLQLETERLVEIWKHSSIEGKSPPATYIDWAKKKNISIPWLAFYEETFDRTKLDDNKKISTKTRNNLLRTIGALNEILLSYPIQTLRHERSDNKTSNAVTGDLNNPVFNTQAELINFIEYKYNGIAGLSKRQLEDIFPQAKRELDQ